MFVVKILQESKLRMPLLVQIPRRYKNIFYLYFKLAYIISIIEDQFSIKKTFAESSGDINRIRTWKEESYAPRIEPQSLFHI